ncbi:DNA gyrase inhibitor YacG [Hansschlegelia beijingensis]|uniref:DNA gyrase inhibitor YacG n=1 Tax=Hansschlegelia beijingensis TaxID=1133344 RepID=A0A7W6GGZ3_9HYPH|nr:DNA gyrase inhibitor YacG [Hansschlegelia beijingensis]MBB3973234.1 hypothetical protein [Hansschlegelia beijingensis]
MADERTYEPRPCPICRKTSTADFHPFCSKRCADVDLSRWLSGVYAVPADDQESDEPEQDGGATH